MLAALRCAAYCYTLSREEIIILILRFTSYNPNAAQNHKNITHYAATNIYKLSSKS